MLSVKDEILIKSQFIQMVRDKDKAIIWHSLFGNPKIVSIEILAFLDIFSHPRQLCSVFDEYNCDENSERAVQDLVENYYLIPKNFDERGFLVEQMKEREKNIIGGSLINYLELIMSEACNFRCSYCIHFNNLEMSNRVKNPKKIMDFEIAKETVDKYLTILRKHGKSMAEINFGGGEPLLAWTVVKQVLEYCQLNHSKKFDFHFSINTNASLVTPEVAEKIKEHRVEIASSLDGLRDGNDLIRLTKSGSGTFEIIMRGFENLAEQSYPMDGIAVTINDQNFPFINEKIIDWAIGRQMCTGCMIEGQCGGGCEITQEFSRTTNTAKIERMCDFYRQMTCELLTEQLR